MECEPKWRLFRIAQVSVSLSILDIGGGVCDTSRSRYIEDPMHSLHVYL